MDVVDFMLFKHITMMFVNYDNNLNLYINGSEIKYGLEHYRPAFPMDQIQMDALNEATIVVSSYYSINIKEFCDFFTYKQMFQQFIIPRSQRLVNEKTARAMLKKLGINFSESTLGQAKDNLDKGYDENLYNYEQLLRKLPYFDNLGH